MLIAIEITSQYPYIVTSITCTLVSAKGKKFINIKNSAMACMAKKPSSLGKFITWEFSLSVSEWSRIICPSISIIK